MQSIRTLYFACLRTSRDAGQGFEASPSNAVSPYMSKDLGERHEIIYRSRVRQNAGLLDGPAFWRTRLRVS